MSDLPLHGYPRDRTGPLPPLPRGAGIVHLVAEYWPFARTGGLAEAVRGLAEYQAAADQAVTIVLPLHRSVRERGTPLEAIGGPIEFPLGDTYEQARIWRATAEETGPTVYFVEHAGYFDRPEIYGEGGDYPDNARRFAFFSRAALEALPHLVPDVAVIHAHDWHTVFSVIYLRTVFANRPYYDRIGTTVTVHNAAFQGHFPPTLLADVGLPAGLYDWRLLEWYDRVNVLKGGLALCDIATTVSPTHAAELRTPEGGFGLHGHYLQMGDRLVGVRNGIDDVFWDPMTDAFLTATFGPGDLEPKDRCKRALQRTYGLPLRAHTPVVVMSARLVEQKGLDLVLADDVFLDLDAQFVFLGRGEPRYEVALRDLAQRAPDRVAVPLMFSERAEHRLLAGADLLLMPSLFEPCGLTQMRAQRYGALPVGRRVGGLNDTIVDGVTGFLFDAYSAPAFHEALGRALTAYADREAWLGLVREAMRLEYGWGPSADIYQRLYRRACRARAA